ncbi:suppressor of glycerol defect [Pseudocyphellaria aurata]|nr:suppressor of glycerol defect [Pseudocyphellaria aurata]
MRSSAHVTAKLPRKLLDEIGIEDDGGRSRGRRNRPSLRKERRKVARVQKKAEGFNSRTKFFYQNPGRHKIEALKDDDPPSSAPQSQIRVKQTIPKSILKKPLSQSVLNSNYRQTKSLPPSPSLASTVPQGTKDKLRADDAEIAALEKALGLKGTGPLPKSFKEDGLDILLDGVEDSGNKEEALKLKRERVEEHEWLERKHRKARGGATSDLKAENEDLYLKEHEDFSDDSSTNDGLSDLREDDGDVTFGFSSEKSSSPEPQNRKPRENPYKAPTVTSTNAVSPKYIPPSLRAADKPLTQDLSILRRQLQGLLNRLSEANILSVLGEVERLYQANARQHVSVTLLDLLMGLLCDPTSLHDTFIILHAGFIAAIYKIIGTEFGAQAVQRIDEELIKWYPTEIEGDNTSKRSANLISLLAELYNFQVIGSNLIYDFIRLFLEDLTEISAELVMKIMRNSGPQLRQDDASSLKTIVLLVQSAVMRKGEETLSVRAKYMIETMNNLKNNRMRTGIAASTIASEHTVRMKKILGTLNMRKVRASEPLQIGLKDLRQSDKRGKWWLVGASYKDDIRDRIQDVPVKLKGKHDETISELGITDDTSTDLFHLARVQRMNTDVRRSIFIAIMSATDYNDAHLRLQKLRLKKVQEVEIPKVLVHCAGAEKMYNPFYSFVARRVCSDRKLKKAFQFSLWDLFKRMGEGQDAAEDNSDDENGDKLGLRSLVNLGKLFGVLIAEGGLRISVLKTLNLAYLQPKTRTFVELLLITVILHSQQGIETQRDEKPIREVFLLSKDIPNLAQGLQYFLKKVVSKTDVAGSGRDHETVRWGCKVAGDELKYIISSMVTEE